MIAADQKYGAWRVLAIKDHAVTCLCRCHTVRVLSLDGILDGTGRAIMRLFAFQ